MNIKEIRRIRLRELTAERGAKAQLSKLTGFSASQISQWLSDDTKTSRLMSEETAREIEKARELPTGWMDSVSMSASHNVGERNKEYTNVQSYELWSGAVDVEVRDMIIPTSWLAEKGFSAEDVVSIEVSDDSQGPRILKGDYACIATKYGDKPRNNALYAIRLGGEYTLRLTAYQRNGDLRLCCQNSEYSHAEELVPKEEISTLDILGEYAGATIRP